MVFFVPIELFGKIEIYVVFICSSFKDTLDR